VGKTFGETLYRKYRGKWDGRKQLDITKNSKFRGISGKTGISVIQWTD